MTPELWFSADTPEPLLMFVNPPNGYFRSERPPPVLRRRWILFGCACSRMVWHLSSTNTRSTVQMRERFADGHASETDLRAVGYWSQQTANTLIDTTYDAARNAAKILATSIAGHAPLGNPVSPRWHEAWNMAFDTARATQAAIVRDIFPPPEYTPRFDPSWLTSTVLGMVRQMDESDDFSATPILADALQDAGCDDDVMLNCCRVPGNVHFRGNWVADLALGR